MALRDLLEHIDIARNQRRFGNDAKLEPRMPRKFFENRPRDLQLALDRLIRIGSRADRNLLARFYLANFLPQKFSRVLLGINLLLELDTVTHLHELVGVARITIFAGKLASPVRIDRPGKRHLS